MKSNNRKHHFLLILLICFSTSLMAQTQFWSDNFEDVGAPSSGTRTPSVENSSGGSPATRYFWRCGTANISTVTPYTSFEGSKFWAGEDQKLSPISQTSHQNITWSSINISGKTGLSFKGLFASGPANFDAAPSTVTTDYIILEYRIDGGAWQNGLRFFPYNPTIATYLSLETTGDSIGEGVVLLNTTAFTEFNFNISGTGTTLDLRLKTQVNGTSEEWAADNFRLFEAPACTNPTINTQPSNSSVCATGNTTFSITATGATSYQWQLNTGSGFNNITNGGVYSNATTATLNITGATAGMNGYLYRCIASDGACSTTSNQATLTVSNPSLTALSQTNISCNGGSNGAASVNPAGGGISPYNYNWTPGNPTGDGTTSVTGLTAGTWTCTVTDNIGCTASVNFNITAPTAITLNALSQTNISCFGGSNGAASVNPASGGAGGFTYNWTPGNPAGDGTTSVTGLTAGTWTCTTTDANGCTATRNFTITSPSAISMTPASQTNVSCNGGSNGAASVNTPTGGAGGFTYNWTPGNPTGDGTVSVTGLTAGTWTCTTTDANGCTAAVNFTITAPTAISLTAASQTNVACNGGSTGAASVNTPTGGAGGFTYNWTPGNPTGDGTTSVTGLTAGTWTCTVTDANSCTAALNFTITQPTALVLNAASQTNVACNGGSTGAASVNAATGGAGGYTYNWTPGNPTGDGTTSVTGLTAGTWTCTVTDANSCTTTRNFTITAPTAISLTAASQTNVSCNGGSNGAASVNAATGGAGGFTYNWTPGNPTGDGTVSVTGLTAGTWTCTTTDANGCTAAVNFTITAPTALSLTAASQTNISCNGGSNGAAAVNAATGGAGGYTYNWTPGNPTGDGTTSVTGLTAGTWTCTVTDANSCTASTNFTITQPTAITANISSTTTSCTVDNGTATVSSVAGGAGGYTYDWTPGTPTGDGTASISGLGVGTWTCTITDANGCSITRNVSVSTASAPSLTAASQTNVACNAGATGAASVNAATGGAGGYTYDWTPGTPAGDGTTSVTGLSAGTYTCTVTDAGGCTAAVNFTITEPTALSVSAAVSSNYNGSQITCNGAVDGAITATPAGGAGGYNYFWSNGQITATAINLAAGNYSVTVVDANGCSVTSNMVTLTEPTVLSATSSQTDITCFGASNGTATVTVTGGTGFISYDWTPGSPTGDGTNAVTGLTAGTWACTATDANGCSTSVNFTITEPSAIVLTAASQTNVGCNAGSDGAASVNTATGGTGSLTYDWTPGTPAGDGTTSITGLTAGTWTCTVTDGNGCTAAVNFTITEPSTVINTPVTTGTVVCQGDASAEVSASATTSQTSSYSITIPIDVAAQPTEVSATSVPGSVAASPNVFGTGTMAALPAGAVVTSATLNYNGIQAVGGSWQSDVRLGLTGGVAQNWTGGIGTANASGTFNYISNIPAGNVNVAGGSISLHYFDFWNDNGGTEATFPTGAGVASITVNYTLPQSASITWWDAASGGTQLGSGSPFETVGTSVIPNTNTPGTYTVYAQAEFGGCPSANRTAAVVTVNATTASTTTISSCTSYMWTDGITYTTSGTYTQTLTNNAGCDSIATLELTITQPTSAIVDEVACSSYFWTANGTTYTTSGTYTVTLPGANAAGCDSTITLNLTINQPSSSADTVTACDSYVWSADGQTYTTSGTYTATLTNAAGCDSVATLELTVNYGSTSTMTASACASYLWGETGQQYTSSGIYSVTYPSVNGCDSIINLDLTIYDITTQTDTVVECTEYTWAQTGITYTTSGIYSDTMASVNGCDSILVLDLTITGFPTATATDNGDATITASAGTTYQWIDCATQQAIVGGTTQTITVTANGDYAVVVTNAGGCSDTSDCVTIDYIGLEEYGTSLVNVFPNPSHDQVTVQMIGTDVQLELVDANGKVLSTSTFTNETSVNLATYPVGVYLIRLKTEGETVVKRLIKQ